MLSILAITSPIFMLIGLGYLVGRRGLLTPDQFRGMGRFVMNVAMPALIIQALGQSAIGDVLNLRYVVGYTGGSLALFGLAVAFGLWVRRKPLTTAALQGLGSSSSNSAFVGYPVAVQFLGPAAAVALALNIVIENVAMISTALALAETGQGNRTSLPRLLGRTFLNLAKTPIILGLATGVFLAATGLAPPAPVAKAINMLAAVSAPLALIVIGGSLVGLEVKSLIGDVAQVGATKLILHPTFVLAGVTLAGLHADDPNLHKAAVVFAAAPMLSVLPVLGQKYGEEGMCSAVLLAATVGSFVSLSGWLWLLSHGWLG